MWRDPRLGGRVAFRTVVALLLALPAFPGVAGGSGVEQPLDVAVSVAPLAELVRRVGGPLVRVSVLTPPGASPETRAPTPREALVLTRADLYVSVGHPGLPFEQRHAAWLEGRDTPQRISMGRAASRASSAGDPHLWMDLDLLASTAREVADWLAGRRPRELDGVDEGLRGYLQEVEAIDAELRRRLADPARPLLFQHPAWTRLLDRYGVGSRSIESEGKEPSPAQLAKLVEWARRAGVETVFAQVGASDRGARLLAGEIGAELVLLDPTTREWLRALRSTGTAFARAAR